MRLFKMGRRSNQKIFCDLPMKRWHLYLALLLLGAKEERFYGCDVFGYSGDSYS